MSMKIKNSNGNIIVDGLVVSSPTVINYKDKNYTLTMVNGNIEVTK